METFCLLYLVMLTFIHWLFFPPVVQLCFAQSKTSSIYFNDPHDLALSHHVLLGAACGGHWCGRTGGYDAELSLGCAKLI